MRQRSRLNSKHNQLKQALGPIYGSMAMFARFEDAVANNDVNNDQPVTDPSVIQPVAPAEGVTAVPPAAPEVPAQPDPIPYDRFKEVNDRMTAAEQQNLQLQQALVARTQPQPAQHQQGGFMDDVDDGDYIDGKTYKAGMVQLATALKQVVGGIQQNVQETQILGGIPDYQTVIGGPTPWSNGQHVPAQPLNDYVQNHPEQAQIINQQLATNTPEAKALVYHLIANDPAYKTAQLTTPQAQNNVVQNAVATANAIPSIGNVPAAGNVDASARFTNMSDAELDAEINRVVASG